METLFVALRVAVSLAAVLALLWWLQRRLTRGGRGPKVNPVSIVTKQAISPKASVVVIEVDGTRLVLGVTEQAVNVLQSAPVAAPAPALALAPVTALPVAQAAPQTADAFARSMDAAAVAPGLADVPTDGGLAADGFAADGFADDAFAVAGSATATGVEAQPGPRRSAGTPQTPLTRGRRTSPVSARAVAASDAPLLFAPAPDSAPSLVPVSALAGPVPVGTDGTVGTAAPVAAAAAVATTPLTGASLAGSLQSRSLQSRSLQNNSLQGNSPLAGSILSPQTWKQAAATLRRAR